VQLIDRKDVRLKPNLRFVARSQPESNRWLVGAQFFVAEVEGDLAFGGLGPVGGVDQVHLAAGAEVAADGAGGGFEAASGAEHFADHADGFEAFDYSGNDRSAGDEAFERRVPIFLHVLGVVFFGQVRRHAHHLHRNDVECLVFEAGDDAAHQAALDTVGFQEDERAFHGEIRMLS
jgi:hypothetical protein